MPRATFRFYEELNDFLPEERRKTDFDECFEDGWTVGRSIQALGVPLARVDLILVNGDSRDFEYVLGEGDRVSVYPVFECLNIKGITRLPDRPLRDPRFIAGAGLETVAERLRLLGLDILFDASLTPAQLKDLAGRQHRIILTDHREFLADPEVSHVIFVGTGGTSERVSLVLKTLDLEMKQG
jgi:hypothetical protein